MTSKMDNDTSMQKNDMYYTCVEQDTGLYSFNYRKLDSAVGHEDRTSCTESETPCLFEADRKDEVDKQQEDNAIAPQGEQLTTPDLHIRKSGKDSVVIREQDVETPVA